MKNKESDDNLKSEESEEAQASSGPDRKRHRGKSKVKRIILLTLAAVFAASLIGGGIFLLTYQHAGDTASHVMVSDGVVVIFRTDYGYFFDGPSDGQALIFYPGGRVDETAYAPLLHKLAEGGLDVCLVKMPLHFAFFGIDKADQVMEMYDYDTWYIGGHSLGGAMAARYASGHGDTLKGLVLLAAYTVDEIGDSQKVLLIRGSNDTVLNMKKYDEGRKLIPGNAQELVIEGGNHAQFGDYGTQRGDGEATISAEEQQKQTADFILRELIP